MDQDLENYTATDKLITRITSWVAGIILIVLAVYGIRSLYQSFYYEETNDAQVQEYINPLVSRIDGYITQIRYNENQTVKKGDTLVIIDKSQYQLQQQESLAAAANAASQVAVLKSTIQTAINNRGRKQGSDWGGKSQTVKGLSGFCPVSKVVSRRICYRAAIRK